MMATLRFCLGTFALALSGLMALVGLDEGLFLGLLLGAWVLVRLFMWKVRKRETPGQVHHGR